MQERHIIMQDNGEGTTTMNGQNLAKIAPLAVILLTLLACSGSEGPMGPQGLQGSQGQAGIVDELDLVTHQVARASYDGAGIIITDNRISPQTVIAIY
jgi:hypothetical protein